MQIHVNCNGQQYGPYTPEELASYLQQGSISDGDWAWHEGLANWVQICQLDLRAGGLQTVQPAAVALPQATETPQQIQETKEPDDGTQTGPGNAGVSAESAMERLRRLQRGRMPASNKATQRPGARSGQGVPKEVQPAEAFDVPEPKQSKGKLITVVGLGVCVAGLIGYAAVHFLGSPDDQPPPRKIVPEDVNSAAVARLQKFGAHVTRDQDNQINGIQFSSNSISTNGWKLLVQLSNIQKLELVGCGIDDVGAENLGKLVHLRRLNLSGNPITDKSADVLKTLKQLQVLNITETEVTKEGVLALQAVLPDCNIDH